MADNPSAPAPDAPARPIPAEPAASAAGRVLAATLAWLVPGLGHIVLRRWRRGIAFFVLVAVALWVGWGLEGNLPRRVPNQPLSYLATLSAMGTGLPYFFLRYGLHYEGNLVAPGYEYGSAFLLTAGLMNLLLIIDVWDIAGGKKE